MPRTRTQGVRDLTGVTGLVSLHAIGAGARDPPRLATRRTPHGHPEADDLATAWQGPGRAAPLVA
jgi:hypothetical protein